MSQNDGATPYSPPKADLAASREQAALRCPRCERDLQPAPDPQHCGGCGMSLLLRAGCLLDSTAQPPHAEKRSFKAKSSGILLRKLGVVGPLGISHGSLDPVTGLVPIDSASIAYDDISSLTAWRRIDWILLVATSILFLPLSLLLVLPVVKQPAMLALAAPVWLLTGFLYWRAIAVGRHFLRVCGSQLTLTLRFDSPFYRRRRLLQAALRRAGIRDPIAPGGVSSAATP